MEEIFQHPNSNGIHRKVLEKSNEIHRKVLDIYKYSQKIVGTRVNKIDTKKKLTVKKNHQYASITKIKKELNWKAKTGIRQGIRKTWEYLNEQ